ncbi:hypothetical protein ABL78_3105 [Leptomonas seymouri]|uniref:Uncharacterized protein n=1 Tax=Leptomonas seymouri TaxID=5684 RepID=A0A0N0P6M3_LEPSE|nr:hypothetical protein ABL78_3105 [Leptomonas seymouri]|eukprot:KPI87806.1 hypothetical protein ABL78_3105 [Leptomonas seymouri]
MDAAALFNERKADVAAFTALLFRGGAEQQAEDGRSASKANKTGSRDTKRAKKKLCKSTRVSYSPALTCLTSSNPCGAPAYRRPASANVPVSRVLQEAKARAARRMWMEEKRPKKQQLASSSVEGQMPTIGNGDDNDSAAASRRVTAGAFGFTAQELRDRTYLWMSHSSHFIDSAQDVSRQASKLSGELTPSQQAELRRLRIKQRHQHLLPYSQWILWLRRRRRLWQRRRPVMRRRHLRRRLALQHGRLLGPCACCAHKNRASGTKVSSKRSSSRVAQWLPSHARLVKRFHHRVVSLVVTQDVTHAKDIDVATAKAKKYSTGVSKTSQLKKRKAVPTASLSVPMAPMRKGHRFLQRWATELGVQQRRHSKSHGTNVPNNRDTLHTSSALGKTLMADVSHQCVYAITQPKASHGAPSSSLTLSAVVQALGVRSAPSNSAEAAPTTGGMLFSVALTALHQRIRESAVGAVHGHMWSAAEENRAAASTRSGTPRNRRRVSTVARHTRVVPVVLVSYAGSGAGDSPENFLLFSEAPVLLSRRARTTLRIQLISAWNPCCRCPTFASIYEIWRCDPSTRLKPSSAKPHPPALLPLTALRTVKFAKSVLRRCARVFLRLRHRAAIACRHRMRNREKNRSAEAGALSSLRREGQQKRKGRTAMRTGAQFAVPRRRGKGSWVHTLPRVSLVVFPSFPAPFLLAAPDQQKNGTASCKSAPYAWRVGLIYHRGERCLRCPVVASRDAKTENEETAGAAPAAVSIKNSKDVPGEPTRTASSRRLYCASVRARRAHFHLARRFFGFLLTTPVESTSVSSLKKRARTRVLGLNDRATLLRLVGTPAYPLDYGQSRPSAASQQRSGRHQHTPAKCLVTRPGAKRARCTSSATARDGEEERSTFPKNSHHPPVTFPPSYVHTLEYYGNPTNASCRVTVRSAHVDRKLPVLHSTVGCILLRCRGTASNSETVVEQIGVVSSSSFFAQRFGCMVAPVWCCFPPILTCVSSCDSTRVRTLHGMREGKADGRFASAAADRVASWVERRDDCWTAASLHTTQLGHKHMWFVLAHPGAAATLIQLSASLQRECPPRQRALSRHQRAFDLTRGRTTRKLEAFLCDPTFCSPVELIRWHD